MGREKNLEKIQIDYARWLLNLDFCTPRYIITRELGIDKLRIRWSLRAWKFEEKIKEMEDHRWVKHCWEEKKRENWGEQYSKDREKYYNRNGWGITAVDGRIEEKRLFAKILKDRDRDIQIQKETERISEAKYNRYYSKIGVNGRLPKYLDKGSLEESRNYKGIVALAKLRCGNLEEANKYWLEKKWRKCVFCNEGWDDLNHFVRECEITKDWFDKIGKN